MKKLMLMDQIVSSLTSFFIPIAVISILGEYAMVKFTYIQSFGLYIVAILNSLFVMPYLYVSKNDNNIGFNDNTLRLFAYLIAIISGLALLIFQDLNSLFILLFVNNLLKEILRTISLNNNKFNRSLFFQTIPLFIAIVIFLSCENFQRSLIAYLAVSNIIAIGLNYSIEFRLDMKYIGESIDIGKWSVFNMLLQLIITQIIIYRITVLSVESIVVYGVLVNILGVFNPVLSFLNNYALKDFRAQNLKTEKLNIYKINVIRYLIVLSSIIVILYYTFTPLCRYFYHQNYKDYSELFLILSISLVFTAIGQLNSRLLTLFSQRRVVFDTSICSLIAVLSSLVFVKGDWTTHFMVYFVISRIAGWSWSQYKVLQLENG